MRQACFVLVFDGSTHHDGDEPWPYRDDLVLVRDPHLVQISLVDPELDLDVLVKYEPVTVAVRSGPRDSAHGFGGPLRLCRCCCLA